jgi:DinB superfamily
MPEPWLSGSLQAQPPPLAAALYSLQQIREDIEHWTADLTDEQIWSRPHGLAPVGFQLRHIAGSIDRLFTYARGRELTAEQMATLKSEMEPGATRHELVAAVETAIDGASAAIRLIDPATLNEPRTVGRKHLPTTLIGLLFHLAEHAQRHTGELIITAKVSQRV